MDQMRVVFRKTLYNGVVYPFSIGGRRSAEHINHNEFHFGNKLVHVCGREEESRKGFIYTSSP
jgi:hypothetical protein